MQFNRKRWTSHVIKQQDLEAIELSSVKRILQGVFYLLGIVLRAGDGAKVIAKCQSLSF